LAAKTVGNILTRLGFKPTRIAGGRYSRFWDEARLTWLEARFDFLECNDGFSEFSEVSELNEGG
jgi:hypothetical protein